MLVLSRALLTVSFVAFVGLGVPDGLLGTGWPSIRADLERPLADLGALITAGIGGFATASALTGRLARRFSTGDRLLASYVAVGSGAALMAGGGSWGTLLAAAATIGIGNGLLDPAINAAVAHHRGVRTMSLLHASFGAGATLGPLMMVWFVGGAWGWRGAYWMIAAWATVMFAVMFPSRRRWPITGMADGGGRVGPRLRHVVPFLVAYLFATGVEVSVGAWAFSWLTDGRSVSAASAASLTSAYWGGLLAARLIGSVAGDRFSSRTIMTGSGTLLVAGLGWMWADLAGLGGLGLPVAGAGMGLVFPIIVLATSARFRDSAESVVGWGFAAASVGAAGLPWLVGRVAEQTAFSGVGGVLVAAAIVTAVLGRRLTPSATAASRG